MAQIPKVGNTRDQRDAFIFKMVRTRNLSTTAGMVALAMSFSANKGGICWASNTRIGGLAGCRERTVQRAKVELIERSVLVPHGWRTVKPKKSFRAYKFTLTVSPVTQKEKHKGNGKIEAAGRGVTSDASLSMSPVTHDSKS